jgi:hypothetical protein
MFLVERGVYYMYVLDLSEAKVIDDKMFSVPNYIRYEKAKKVRQLVNRSGNFTIGNDYTVFNTKEEAENYCRQQYGMSALYNCKTMPISRTGIIVSFNDNDTTAPYIGNVVYKNKQGVVQIVVKSDLICLDNTLYNIELFPE